MGMKAHATVDTYSAFATDMNQTTKTESSLNSYNAHFESFPNKKQDTTLPIGAKPPSPLFRAPPLAMLDPTKNASGSQQSEKRMRFALANPVQVARSKTPLRLGS